MIRPFLEENMTITRRSALLGAAALPFAQAAMAQAFPTRPLRIIVAYPAGGPTDAIARIVAQDIAGPLGQNVVVENVGGASGAIGTRQVAKADPDGHVFTFGNNQTHGNNMFLLKDPGYDAVKDFAPLASPGAFEHVFVVRNELPVKSIQELIALAKAKPGELNYGSTGLGSGSHLSTELFMVRTGIKMQHVPFRGAAPLIQEIVGNRIDYNVRGYSHGFFRRGQDSAGILMFEQCQRNVIAFNSVDTSPNPILFFKICSLKSTKISEKRPGLAHF